MEVVTFTTTFIFFVVQILLQFFLVLVQFKVLIRNDICIYKCSKSRKTKEKAQNHCGLGLWQMVEMGGVEPPSESVLTGTSPGADGHLHSLIPAQAVTLLDLVASLCMVHAKLCVRTFTTE